MKPWSGVACLYKAGVEPLHIPGLGVVMQNLRNIIEKNLLKNAHTVATLIPVIRIWILLLLTYQPVSLVPV
jgi:hypothetical protein